MGICIITAVLDTAGKHAGHNETDCLEIALVIVNEVKKQTTKFAVECICFSMGTRSIEHFDTYFEAIKAFRKFCGPMHGFECPVHLREGGF